MRRVRHIGQIWSDPTVAGGVVYVSSFWNEGRLYAFDAATVARLWQTPIGAAISSPTVVNGRVFTSSYSVLVASFGLEETR